MSVSVFSRRPRRLLRLSHVSAPASGSASVPQVRLDDVSLDIFEGQTHAFLTEGSSLIARLIARLVEAENGTLTWRGTFFGWRKAPAVAFVPKGARVTRGVLVRDELLSVLACAGTIIEHTDFDALTRALRIDDVLDCSTSELSDDLAYRVLVARGLMLGARVVVVDEPTHAMSPDDAASLLRHLQRLSSAGLTVIIQTRSPEVAALFSRVSLLIDGSLVGSFVDPDVQVLRAEFSSAMGAAGLGSVDVANEPDQSRELATAGELIMASGADALSEGDVPPGDADDPAAQGDAQDESNADADSRTSQSSSALGALGPRWVPTRPSEHAPLTPIPDASPSSAVPSRPTFPSTLVERPQEIEAASERAHSTDEPSTRPQSADASSTVGSVGTHAARADAASPAAADTQTLAESVSLTTTSDSPDGADALPQASAPAGADAPSEGDTPEGGAQTTEVSETVEGDTPAGGAQTAEGTQTAEGRTGSLVLELDEIPVITTALPVIPRTSREALDADAEKVIEQAQNILKDLPGSVVPQDSEASDAS